MRYGIISDIHSNLEAFEAVIAGLSRDDIDKYICLGDVVGYGADPILCIERLRWLNPEIVIAGNHDYGVLDKLDIDYFSEPAAAGVAWTKGKLGSKEISYLESLKLLYEDKSFTLVHGSLEAPEYFNYIINTGDAFVTAVISKTPVVFVGHSHCAEIYEFDVHGSGARLKGFGAEIIPGRKYVVNVGSVGQPRDRDPRAAYCVFDDSLLSVEIKRVPYDIITAGNKIRSSGLPVFLADRLAVGK